MDNIVKFTVIIPIYNVKRYLSKCFDSIQKQTLHNFEVICINDGSTDNSLAILNEYASKDSRIKIYNQENKGQGIARNRGIDIACGQYVLFVDPDDWIEPHTLEILSKSFDENDVDVIQFNYKKINEYSQKEDLCVLHNEIEKHKFKKNLCKHKLFCWEDIREYCLDSPRLMVWDKAYSSDFLKANNIKCAPNKHGEDHIFAIGAIIKAKRILYLNECLYNYLCRQGSAVNVKTNENFCIFDNIQYVKEFLENNNLLPELEKEFADYKDTTAWCHYANIPDDRKKEYISKFQEISNVEEYRKFSKRIKSKNRTFIENIFSIKNKKENAQKLKVITVLGLEFTLRAKKKEL